MGWIGLALGAFAFLGVANIAMKVASSRGLGAAGILLWVSLGQLPLAVAYWWWKGRPAAPLGPRAWSVAAGLATAVALVFLNESFSRQGSRAGVSVAIMSANFVLVAIVGAVFFRESLDAGRLAGLVATLAGLWLMAR